MRTQGSPESLARTRCLAVARLLEGWQPQEVADFLGVHISSVCRWREQFQEQGWAGLEPAPVPGRPPKLTQAQAGRLLAWVQDKSPQELGLSPGPWTAPRVAALAHKRLGVQFHPRYLNDWLRRHGITPQLPEPIARERDPAGIARWVRYTWPAIKRGRKRRGRPSFSPTKAGC